MSIHRSLKTNKFKPKRSVRKRWERLQKLQKNLKWLEKNYSVYGIPKEKIVRLKLKIKQKKEEKEDTNDLMSNYGSN